jgi:hypothetical protein
MAQGKSATKPVGKCNKLSAWHKKDGHSRALISGKMFHEAELSAIPLWAS